MLLETCLVMRMTARIYCCDTLCIVICKSVSPDSCFNGCRETLSPDCSGCAWNFVAGAQQVWSVSGRPAVRESHEKRVMPECFSFAAFGERRCVLFFQESRCKGLVFSYLMLPVVCACSEVHFFFFVVNGFLFPMNGTIMAPFGRRRFFTIVPRMITGGFCCFKLFSMFFSMSIL